MFFCKHIDEILENSQKMKKFHQFQLMVSEDINHERECLRQVYIDLSNFYFKKGEIKNAFEVLSIFKKNYPQDGLFKNLNLQNLDEFLQKNAS